MAANTLLLLTLLTITTITTTATTVISGDPPPVHDILHQFNLPIGLLPNSVKSYTLSDDGAFAVELHRPCYIQFDYLVYYDTMITGNINVGSISHLHGIHVKKLFVWLNVDEIRVDSPRSDCIYFSVGIVDKKLDIDQFQTIHSCRDNTISSNCAYEVSVAVR